MKNYDLERFVKAQESDYPVALEEIRAGHKYSHWIWYIFPQLEELGRSRMAKFYGIEDIDEARAYLNHPVLGARLREICEALMQLKSSDPSEVMGGYPDDVKLQSCMTLFAEISEADSVFHRVLGKFFAGQQDAHTLSMLRPQSGANAGHVLAILILCTGMLLSAVCSPSCAEVWKTGETRTLSTDYIVDGHHYELIKGTFRFPYDDPPDGTGIFFFTKGFFAEDPYTYNPHLATASICMAMAGCYSHDGGKGKNIDYSNKNKNAIQYLKDIGCQDIHTNFYNTIRPQTDSIGVTMGRLDVDMPDGTNRPLVVVTVRGANYEREWTSNVTVGTSADYNGEAKGFAEAADMVVKEIQSYISSKLPDYEDYNDIIFWVAGYSRGGAVANLTAKRLVDICRQKGAANAKIFAYCFESPMGGFASAELQGANYNCIHNVVNPCDIAPKLAPGLMGFKRYGVDHYIPDTADKNVMIHHLHALNQSVDVSLLKEQIPAYGLNISLINRELGLFAENSMNSSIETFAHGQALQSNNSDNTDSLIPTKQNVLMNEFLDDFMSNIQIWTSLTRNVYIGRRENGVCYGDMQQAARDFMSLFDDLPDSERKEFKNRIQSWAVGDMFGALDLAVNFCKAFGNYYTYDNEKKNMFKNKLIEWIKGSQCFDALSLTDAEKERVIDYDLRTLIDFVMTYLSQDFRHPLYGVEGLTQFLTMLSAADTVKTNHYPEVNMAWLRAMDSFYEGETEIVTRAASGIVSSEFFAADSGDTEGRVLAGAVPVGDITADYGTDYIAILPAKTYIEYTNGKIEEAAITWDTVNYERYYYNENEEDIDEYGEFAGWTRITGDEDPKYAAHIYRFSGKVNIPDGVSVVDEADTEVYVSVFVAGLPKMNAPCCWLPDGDYVSAVKIYLTCEEDADIYYSVDGAGIVYEKYTEPFTLEVGGGVSKDYYVIAYTKSSSPDRADSRRVMWSYTLWQSEAAMYGETRSGSSGGGCEVSCGVCVIGLALLGLMVRKARG